MTTNGPWRPQSEALGAFIRAQRRLADLSLREMATITHVSNAYLSQIERGLHQPSVRVLSAIAEALGVPPDELLAEAGMGGRTRGEDAATDAGETVVVQRHVCSTEEAIAADPQLTPEQRQALLGVYRSFVVDRQ